MGMTKKQRSAIKKVARMEPAVGLMKIETGLVVTNGALVIHIPQKTFDCSNTYPVVDDEKYVAPAKELLYSVVEDGDFTIVDSYSYDGKITPVYIKANKMKNDKFGFIIKLWTTCTDLEWPLYGYYRVDLLRLALAAVGQSATLYMGTCTTYNHALYPLLYVIPDGQYEFDTGVRAVLFPVAMKGD